MKPYKIDDDYRITHDSNGLGWVLQHTRTVKGETVWEAAGYYPDLPSLLRGYFRYSPARHPGTLPEWLSTALNSVEQAVSDLAEKLPA